MSADAERRALHAAWPDAFEDGIRRALNGDDDSYPPGFPAWPIEKRNA